MELRKIDLDDFKKELLVEIQSLLTQRQISRRWLKSYEVMRMLKVAPGTLLNMRNSGALPFVRIGGVMYYDYEDITKMLEMRKSNRIGGLGKL